MPANLSFSKMLMPIIAHISATMPPPMMSIAGRGSFSQSMSSNAGGIVISGTKAIVTGAPYMHEFLVMPCRSMDREDADFAVCCAVRVDEPGITIASRPAGRPGEKVEHGEALFSRKYGQSTRW